MISGKNLVNYLWLDVETTGRDALRQDIIEIACVPIIGGVEQTNIFQEYCQPLDWKTIEQEALDISNITISQLRTFQSADKMVEKLITYLRSFGGIKFTMAGFNVPFDQGFIASTFKKVGKEKEFYELFTSDLRCTYKRAKALKSQLNTPNLKLGTLCAHFDIEINAHEALSDIQATIKLDKILSKMLGETETYVSQIRHITDVIFPEPAQLHCHSKFSHTDSLNSIQEWADYCLNNNIPGFSVVDHGNATSLYEMSRLSSVLDDLAKEKNLKIDKSKLSAIPGSGLYVKGPKDERFFLNAWAVSNDGYSNLVKLASIGWINRIEDSGIEMPLLSIDELKQYDKDIVFGIPGINGPATKLLASNRRADAIEIVEFVIKSLKNVRLELAGIDVFKYFDDAIGFRDYNVAGGNIQENLNKLYFEIASKHNIKCIPVSDSHYIDPADKLIQDCISKNSYKDNRYFFESRHVIKAQEMFSVLKAHLGDSFTEDLFKTMIENTYEIMNLAKNIVVKYDYHLPQIDIPDAIKLKTDDYGMQCYYYTMQKIKEHGRWNDSPEYTERFKKEIDVIMKNTTLNFLPYFLMYEDVCAHARSSGFLQNIARGSAGGSLLSYYLKIIHVDPVAAHLPFERFLSHARIKAGSFPDIDLDIADRARPLVMQYLKDKYKLGFAQIATFNKMKTKNAIKDAMYALYGRNRNDFEVKTICDSIPDSPQGVDEYDFLYGYEDQEGEVHKGQIEQNQMLANFFKQRPEVESMVKKLIGSIRGWSRHASAFVISTLDLSSGRIPTMVMSDRNLGEILVTQYDAPMVEKSGLVKADILGIKTLAMVSDCVDLIYKNHGKDLKEELKGVPFIYRLPDADHGVFGDFYNKDTDSTFQFNTELIKGYAQEFAPLNRADLAAMTALCRPGALDAPFEDTTAAQYFMDVKNGKRSVKYLHSDLEPILKDSNGVFVYQEEVMRFLVEIAGYTWEESDMIRSAIAKKKHEVIMASFEKIRKSCTARNWLPEAIEQVCQQIMAFSRYSFNKSHSYAYGELGYITLYLKHHYPLEWWCSVLNNEDNEDKTRKYISYLGDKVAPPSLKNPKREYAIVDGKIVAPISAIKSVGPASYNEIVSKGPFISLHDYVKRVDHSKVNIGAMSALIKARAADDLMDMSIADYPQRRTAFMNEYCSLRKEKTGAKSEFKEEMYQMTPISLFLDEREYNQSFNKNLLASKDIGDILQSKWPALKYTGRKGIPYMMQGANDATPVLANIKLAEAFLKKGHEEDVAMILLYDSSHYKSGISKTSGKTWHRVNVNLSDGYNTIECTKWDAKKAFGWPANTIVYIRGKLKTGWKTPVSITIDEIVKVE